MGKNIFIGCFVLRNTQRMSSGVQKITMARFERKLGPRYIKQYNTDISVLDVCLVRQQRNLLSYTLL
jgi:hypothetical protein